MIRCHHCNDRQLLIQGKKSTPCPYCINEERLITSIKRAISDAKKDGKKELAIKLQSVLSFLPEYPVVAILEAEALELNENFILMIRDSFNILPFK
jgi:hypothetical protein